MRRQPQAEYEREQLTATPLAWQKRVRREIGLMLAQDPRETSNEGPGMLISELLSDDIA